jgi:hypothetical protein
MEMAHQRVRAQVSLPEDSMPRDGNELRALWKSRVNGYASGDYENFEDL